MMAVIMLLFLFVATRGAGKAVLEENHLKGFKGDTLSATVRLGPRRLGWTSISASSAIAGVEQAGAAIQDGKVTLNFETRYAGRFRGLGLRLEFGDPLQLFSKVHEISYDDFTVDVLPLSLLRPTSARKTSMLTLGEEPAGAPGMGQELFSIDEYEPFSDPKNIIWKRVARSPDQSLFVRIRESNVPSVIRVGLLDAARRDERLSWVDLFCEGVGLLGKELIDLGCHLEVSYGSPSGLMVCQVSDLQDLAEALLSFSSSASGAQFGDQLIDQSDVIVTGLREVEEPNIARTLSRKPSMLIHERASPMYIGERSVVFTGRESIFPFVARVVER